MKHIGIRTVFTAALAIAAAVVLMAQLGASGVTRGHEVTVADPSDRVPCSSVVGHLPERIEEYSSTLDRETGTITIDLYGKKRCR